MKKGKIFKSIITVFILATIICPRPALAIVSWPDIIGFSYKQTMEQIALAIRDAIRGALKRAAVETIHSTVNNLISGGSARGGALFITNWEDYLVRQPQREAELYLNDVFTLMMRGTGSAVNYAGRGGEGLMTSSITQQFTAYKKGAFGYVEPYNLSSYCSDPSVIVGDNWNCYRAYWSNDMNNLFGRQAAVWEPIYLAKTGEAQRVAQTKAMAYGGFLPQEKNGQVITPGSTIAEIQAQTEKLGYEVLANAEALPDIITALVIDLTNTTIQQGIGNAQRQVQREITNSVSGTVRNMNESINTGGLGSVFQSKY